MDFIGGEYYKLTRIFLLSTGLWPYQNLGLKTIQVIFVQTLLISFLVCQFNTFLVRKFTVDLFIRVSTFIIINLFFILEYNAFLLFMGEIKYIFERVQSDWNMLKSKAELDIMQRYTKSANLYGIFSFVLSVNVTFGSALLYYIPIVLDIIAPLNEPRPRQLVILVEYFVDQETYFYAFLAHSIAANYAGCMTVTAMTTLFLEYILHICALFKITSYRIEHLFDKSALLMSKDVEQYIMYEKLICAISIHRRAIDLTNIIMNKFGTLFFILLIMGIISICLSFVGFLNAATSLDDKIQLLVFIIIVMIHLYYTFIINYIGQEIIDVSSDIAQTAYNIQWYAAPLWMQKLLLFIMKRSSKSTALITGSLFQPSLEGFATVISMSASYIMFILSTRPKYRKL